MRSRDHADQFAATAADTAVGAASPARTHGSPTLSRRQMLMTMPALLLAPRAFAQSGGSALTTRGFTHVRLSVSDVGRSVDFYQGLFGMPVISRQNTTVNLQIGTGPQFLSIAPAGSSAPSLSSIGLGVENFNADRAIATLGTQALTMADASAGPGLGGPLRMRVQRRSVDGAPASDATTEFFFTDPDGILVQLQDPSYCGGTGPLGNVPSPAPSPKKGVLALRGWSHCTIFGSDGARSNKFYQDVFGLRIQAYQGANAPVMGIGGVQFLMFAGAGGRGRGGGGGGSINHLCMNMDGFKTETVIAALESYGIKPRGAAGGGAAAPLVHYISTRTEARGGAKEGTPELYFTDPDGLLMQLQDTTYCGGAGLLGEICKV